MGHLSLLCDFSTLGPQALKQPVSAHFPPTLVKGVCSDLAPYHQPGAPEGGGGEGTPPPPWKIVERIAKKKIRAENCRLATPWLEATRGFSQDFAYRSWSSSSEEAVGEEFTAFH